MKFVKRFGFDDMEMGHHKTISGVVSDQIEDCYEGGEEVSTLNRQVSALTNLLAIVVEMLPEEKQIELAEKVGFFPVLEPEKKRATPR